MKPWSCTLSWAIILVLLAFVENTSAQAIDVFVGLLKHTNRTAAFDAATMEVCGDTAVSRSYAWYTENGSCKRVISVPLLGVHSSLSESLPGDIAPLIGILDDRLKLISSLGPKAVAALPILEHTILRSSLLELSRTLRWKELERVTDAELLGKIRTSVEDALTNLSLPQRFERELVEGEALWKRELASFAEQAQHKPMLLSLLNNPEQWLELVPSNGFHSGLSKGRLVSRVFLRSGKDPTALLAWKSVGTNPDRLLRLPSSVGSLDAVLVTYLTFMDRSGALRPSPLISFVHSYKVSSQVLDHMTFEDREKLFEFGALRRQGEEARGGLSISIVDYSNGTTTGIREVIPLQGGVVIRSTRGLCLQCHSQVLASANQPYPRQQTLKPIRSWSTFTVESSKLLQSYSGGR